MPPMKTNKKAVSVAPERRTQFTVRLDPKRTNQLQELRDKFGGNENALFSQAIALWHGTAKKEWPDDFN